MFHADGRTGMKKLIVALRSFANTPKMAVDKIASTRQKVTQMACEKP